MKRIITAIVLAAVLTLASTASASPPGTHWCGPNFGQTGWPVLASNQTSCPFAVRVARTYVRVGSPNYWRGWITSLVTHQRYLITCRRASTAYNSWMVATGPNHIFTRTI
jgi:hypothetical protein